MSVIGSSGLSLGHKVPATLALALLALVGNYLSLELFFGVSFIFGSIMVMLSVRFLGTFAAVLVAIIGSLYTLVLWGHPYALMTFTFEALVVGLLYQRGLRNLVLADLVFWLVLGIPLVLVSYRWMIGMEWEATTLIALKQSLNGLFNALLAGLVILGLQLYWRGGKPRVVGNARLPDLLFHVLLTAILLAGAVPVIVEGYNQRGQLEAFMAERLSERASDVAARLTVDPTLQWQKQLATEQQIDGMGFALRAPDGETLVRKGEVASLSERPGQLHSLENGLSIWLPTGDIPTMPRWKQGRYQVSVPAAGIEGVAEVVIEQSAKPLVQKLERRGLSMFALLAGLLVLSILVTRVLSQWLTRPLSLLNQASTYLTAQIAEGMRPSIPESRVQEYASLGQTLQEMSDTLADSFHELHQAQAGLESQVCERTAELSHTTEQLQAILAAASEFAIVATNRDGLITLLNHGAEKITGYDADDLVGQQTPALFHLPEEIAARSAELSALHGQPVEGFRAFTEVAGREGAETREWTFVRKDGLHIPVALTVTPQVDKTGHITGYLGIAEDVSERKAAEQALRESEQRFRDAAQQLTLATEAARLGVWDLNLASGRLDWDKGMLRIYGMAEQNFGHVVEEWTSTLLPESREQATADFERGLVHAEAPYESEFCIRRGDGQIRYIRAMAQGITGPEDRVERVIGINEDITERKKAEIALMEQAQHTQTILDNMVDGIITIKTNGIMQSFNPAAMRIFGYTEDEVLGRNVSMLMPSPHREAHDSYLRNYQSTGIARIIGNGREVEGLRKDGSLFPMELAVSEISQHEQTLYVGMVRDISERKRMERMKSEFVSTVSHELRTPLTSITGALGLVVGWGLGELPEQVQQMIGIAHNNSQRLTHLINDLLDIEKIAAGKLHFEMQVQPLMPLIKRALESHRTYGTDRQVELVLEGKTSAPDVRVDSQRLEQVLANLLSNAIKFSPEGGTVSISVQPLPEQVRVIVADQGPGIAEVFHSRIFEKFSQADSSDTRQQGGTGLGLAITRELLEHMGGRVGFDSVEGEGAAFWFELPLIDKHRFDPDAVASAPVPPNASRILIVEDEPDVAKVLAALLTSSGYRVDIAYTGEQALAALADTRYDALSLDLMLPDISGIEIIRRIRKQPHTENLPIVVVSARMEDGRLAISSDFFDINWLAKPIDERQLLETVESVLGSLTNKQPRVLHVEDNTDLHQVIRAMIGGRFDIELVTSLGQARERVAMERFDVVILDIGLPDGSGWDLLPEIRARQPEAQVFILSGTDITTEEALKVETVLLKTQVSPRALLDALSNRIHHQARRNST